MLVAYYLANIRFDVFNVNFLVGIYCGCELAAYLWNFYKGVSCICRLLFYKICNLRRS